MSVIVGMIGGAIVRAAIWDNLILNAAILAATIVGAAIGAAVWGELGASGAAVWGGTIGGAIFAAIGVANGAWLYILLSGGLGISIGIGIIIGFSPYIILALAATGLPLAGMLIYPPLRQRRLKAQYYRHEAQNLIEP